MIQKDYEILSYRYKNKIFLEDDYGIKGVILFNESLFFIKKKWIRYKLSKLSLIEKKPIKIFNNPTLDFSVDPPKVIGRKKIKINQDLYKVNIIEFAKYFIGRGHDWMLFGKKEWEEIIPEKKKKFIKPKKRKR